MTVIYQVTQLIYMLMLSNCIFFTYIPTVEVNSPSTVRYAQAS